MNNTLKDLEDTDHIKAIPYGITDYQLIREEDYFYIDKTPFLKVIKDAGRFLFFIRPRRFGKSLFLAMMEAYYDVAYKDKYEELFKGTWIYDHPTEDKHNYLVLNLNFSVVEPEPKKMAISFHNHVQIAAVSFIQRYSNYLSTNKNKEYLSQKIKESRSATDILTSLLELCKGAQQKLYVLIDEYDNFANTILTTVGEKAYRELTHGPGFFRSFFNALKKGTTGSGAPISRSFITGVSPITMDDVTSGYNIGDNISSGKAFNRMLGFTRHDVLQMIEYYRTAGLISHETNDLMEIIDLWYGNYLFSPHALDDLRMFNPDMVLYFLKEYFRIKTLPDDLIDRNVRIDYGKLRHLIILDRGESKHTNGNFSQLKEIIEKGSTSTKLVTSFPLEKMIESANFKSLLFYFGLLTIKEPDKDKTGLEIPNETIKRLFYDYIEAAYRETGTFALNLSHYSDLFTDMAYDGKWKPLFKFITDRMRDSMSLRDLITGEKSIQAFLNVYLGLSDLYIIHCEKEMNKGFADIVMEPFVARYSGIKFSYILEIKYVKACIKVDSPQVQQSVSEATQQLAKYSIDRKFAKSIEQTTLIRLALVFSGNDLIYLEEV